VVDKFDLRRRIRLNSKVTSAVWDEGSASWTTGAEDGFTIRSRYLISTTGVLSVPQYPDVPGREDFLGETYHPVRWPKEPVDFRGKRVAVIGNRLDRRPDRPGDRGRGRVAGDVPALRHLGHAAQQPPDRGRPAGVPQGELRADQGRARRLGRRLPAHSRRARSGRRTPRSSGGEFFEGVWNSPGFAKISTNYEDLLFNQEANRDWCDFMAGKIRELVSDPATAETLIPTDHLYVGLRPPYVTGYYEMYNKPNVELVSLRETPIVKVTETGIETSDGHARVRHHHLGDRLRLRYRRHAADGHRGAGGLTLNEYWADGPLTTSGS